MDNQKPPTKSKRRGSIMIVEKTGAKAEVLKKGENEQNAEDRNEDNKTDFDAEKEKKAGISGGSREGNLEEAVKEKDKEKDVKDRNDKEVSKDESKNEKKILNDCENKTGNNGLNDAERKCENEGGKPNLNKGEERVEDYENLPKNEENKTGNKIKEEDMNIGAAPIKGNIEEPKHTPSEPNRESRQPPAPPSLTPSEEYEIPTPLPGSELKCHLNTNNVSFMGWAFKQKSFFTCCWSKRYFVLLKEEALVYYADVNGKAKLLINFQELEVVSKENRDGERHPYLVYLGTKKGEILMAFDNETVRDQWLEKIEEKKKNSRS